MKEEKKEKRRKRKMSYQTFTRTWWRENRSWPNGLEPHAGRKSYYATHDTEEEAREACKKWNTTHGPGRLSKKMEYEQT